MVKVHEWNNGRTAMSALEGQPAGRQGRDQTVALVSVQAVVEFDGTWRSFTGKFIKMM